MTPATRKVTAAVLAMVLILSVSFGLSNLHLYAAGGTDEGLFPVIFYEIFWNRIDVCGATLGTPVHEFLAAREIVSCDIGHIAGIGFMHFDFIPFTIHTRHTVRCALAISLAGSVLICIDLSPHRYCNVCWGVYGKLFATNEYMR